MFTMQYLDESNTVILEDDFQKLRDAMDAAEDTTGATGFNITGMGQTLCSKKHSLDKLDWIGGQLTPEC